MKSKKKRDLPYYSSRPEENYNRYYRLIPRTPIPEDNIDSGYGEEAPTRPCHVSTRPPKSFTTIKHPISPETKNSDSVSEHKEKKYPDIEDLEETTLLAIQDITDFEPKKEK